MEELLKKLKEEKEYLENEVNGAWDNDAQAILEEFLEFVEECISVCEKS
jgi:hypothetical protein